jgi:Domain of unknown function (DUF4349)
VTEAGQPQPPPSSGPQIIRTASLSIVATEFENMRQSIERTVQDLKGYVSAMNAGGVLEVEREIARVRGEIEQLETLRKDIGHRVSYAAVTLTVAEEREATLDTGAATFDTRFHNALIDGLLNAYDSVTAVLLFAVQAAPVVLLWGAILWWPARKAHRVMRQAAVNQ